MRLKYLISIAASTALLASCVKERGVNFVNQSTSSPNVVNFPNQTEAAALSIATAPTIYTFYVEAASSDNSKPATTVTIQKNTTLVTAAGHEILPDSTYQLLSTTSTVDPTTGLAPFKLQVSTSKFDLTQPHDYAVGFSIASTTNGIIAINKQTDVITVGVKNKYDGVYQLKVSTTGWAAYGIADGATLSTYPAEAQLVTAGVNTVTLNIPLGLGNLQPALTSGGGATGFGATTPLYTFDNSTNKLVSVVNSTPDDGRGRKLTINAAATGTNYFDPATHNIYMNYTMMQNGRPNQVIVENFIYLRSR